MFGQQIFGLIPRALPGPVRDAIAPFWDFFYPSGSPGWDGMTILYGPWDPLAQALGDQTLRARYEDFDYLGGTGDIRVNYARTDIVPGGLKAPRDIMKSENLILGALNKTASSGLLPHLALDALGIKHKMIVGYRGGNDVFLAMQRGEVKLVFNTVAGAKSIADSFELRRTALMGGIPYFTTVSGIIAAVDAIAELNKGELEVAPLQSYFLTSSQPAVR